MALQTLAMARRTTGCNAESGLVLTYDLGLWIPLKNHLRAEASLEAGPAWLVSEK